MDCNPAFKKAIETLESKISKYEQKPGSPGVHREKKLTADFKDATDVSISPEAQEASNIDSYVRGMKPFALDTVEAKPLKDVPAVVRANFEYGKTRQVISDLNNMQVGDTLTLDEIVPTSKSNKGLQEFVNRGIEKGKKPYSYMYIKNPKKGIDINERLPGTKFSEQDEVVLKPGLTLKKIEDKELNGVPYYIFEAIN